MNRIHTYAVVLLTLIAGVFAFGCSPSIETNGTAWERFRGPNGTGVSPEGNLPVHWDEDGSGVRWTVEVPPSISSPIVSNSQVILTAETIAGSETSLKVLSVDLKSGKQLWETEVFSRKREDFSMRSVMNSSAGPTPATDGKHIYAYFGSHLAALDFKGKVVWLQHIDPNYLNEIRYGAGSSVVLTEKSVIVLRDREEAEAAPVGWLAAYDKKNGERLWRKQWKDTCCSYTTPLLLQHDSKTEILVALAGRITSFSVDSGKRLWKLSQTMNQPVASPVLADNLLCSATGAHGVKNAACWELDTEKRPKKMATELWAARRGVNATASPVLYNGLLFSITDHGVFYAFDPKTGRGVWRTRLAQGPYIASLTAGDGKVYAFSRHGVASVVAASFEFELLAENTLPHTDIVASPAIADGCLLVRSKSHLMCIEGSEAP